MTIAHERSLVGPARNSLKTSNIVLTSEPSSRANFGNIAIYSAGMVACLLLLGFASIKPFSILAIGGDDLATWVYAKSYIDGFGFRINSSLAFPGVMDNAYFPSFDFSYRLFLRIVGLSVTDAASSYYLMYLVGVCAMYGATTFALKSLGFRAWLSAVGAIVYVVSPYFAFRSFVHDFLALYYAAPLGAALALRIGISRRHHVARFFRQTGVLLSLAVVATSGLYYAFFSLLFISFSAASAAISRRSIRPIIIAALIAVVVFPLLVVTGFGSGVIDVLTGAAPIVKRSAQNQLVFGLNLAEATHLFNSVPGMEKVHQVYLRHAASVQAVLGLEDWPGLVLTGVIFSSPLIVAAARPVREQTSTWGSLIFLSSACIVFGIIYSINGGLAYYFNLFVNPSIRATGRVIPFLSFFALVIALSWVEMLSDRSDYLSALSRTAILAALVIAMIPSTGSLSFRQRSIMSGQTDNIASVRRVLDAKDRAGITTVLQLPHLPWPEVGGTRGFDPYSLQNYYVFDRKHSPTRWSYGGNMLQPSYLLVGRVLQDHMSSGLVGAARGIGFDGALLEKQPYEESEWRSLAANLSADACKEYEDDRRILFSFKPCQSPARTE